jgi:hypothetical protein
MRIGEFHCQICQHDKIFTEAEAQGCATVGPSKDHNYYIYRLSCGHEQEIQKTVMRRGTFRCQTCEDYSFTKPSTAYLLHIKVGPDEWLKLGYSKDIDLRTTQYGLPSNTEVSLLASQRFDTGLEAIRFEKALHTKYGSRRLSAEEMAVFHSKGGQTECYPVQIVGTLMAEFR